MLQPSARSSHWEGSPAPLLPLLLILFTILAKPHSVWHLRSLKPGTEPMPPALEAWSLNHWTAMEVPRVPVYFLNDLAG